MIFRNYTPFPPLQFESRDAKLNDFGVVVLRGTFRYENGKSLMLAQSQEPILLRDEYHGDPTNSSLHLESSIAPFKPATDILLTAHAFSPSGHPERVWDVHFKIGSVKKSLTVTGRRNFILTPTGYRLADPEPSEVVPIRYELAFGGRLTTNSDSLKAFCEGNPVGCGCYDKSQREKYLPAPQILPLGRTNFSFGEPIEPVGFGPIAPMWYPRSSKAGTYNVVWEKTRWPELPEDFSFAFYNTASQGLTTKGFVNGDEEIELVNLTRDHNLRFKLPGIRLATLMRFNSGHLVPGPIFLDTIHIETERKKVYLTWRAVFPLSSSLRALEIRGKTALSTAED